MDERRKHKRTELQSKLIVKRLDGKEHEEVAIDIIDVSKSGVGFKCKESLNIGSMYESYLTIWTQEVLHTCLQIVRVSQQDEEYSYGAVFIAMPEVDAYRIEVYQTVRDYL